MAEVPFKNAQPEKTLTSGNFWQRRTENLVTVKKVAESDLFPQKENIKSDVRKGKNNYVVISRIFQSEIWDEVLLFEYSLVFSAV